MDRRPIGSVHPATLCYKQINLFSSNLFLLNVLQSNNPGANAQVVYQGSSHTSQSCLTCLAQRISGSPTLRTITPPRWTHVSVWPLYLTVKFSVGGYDGHHVSEIPADQPSFRRASSADSRHREWTAQAPAQPGVLHHPVPGKPSYPGWVGVLAVHFSMRKTH